MEAKQQQRPLGDIFRCLGMAVHHIGRDKENSEIFWQTREECEYRVGLAVEQLQNALELWKKIQDHAKEYTANQDRLLLEILRSGLQDDEDHVFPNCRGTIPEYVGETLAMISANHSFAYEDRERRTLKIRVVRQCLVRTTMAFRKIELLARARDDKPLLAYLQEQFPYGHH